MDQLSIFEELYPKYKITKPIRLIELFAGYGSQAFALEYLGVPFEHWKIAEWNYKSFDAYNRFHIDISRRMKTHRGTVQKNVSQTLTTSGGETQGVLDGYTIRKLTPKECFRLQGVKDKDYAKIDDLNDGTKYHLAGDSIVVNVLMAIFKQML